MDSFFTLNMILPSCVLTMQEVDCKTVGIFARGVKQKVWTEAKNRERDWEETLKILSPRARKTYATLYRFLY